MHLLYHVWAHLNCCTKTLRMQAIDLENIVTISVTKMWGAVALLDNTSAIIQISGSANTHTHTFAATYFLQWLLAPGFWRTWLRSLTATTLQWSLWKFWTATYSRKGHTNKALLIFPKITSSITDIHSKLWVPHFGDQLIQLFTSKS